MFSHLDEHVNPKIFLNRMVCVAILLVMQMCSENQFPKEIVFHLDKNRTYFGTINVPLF